MFFPFQKSKNGERSGISLKIVLNIFEEASERTHRDAAVRLVGKPLRRHGDYRKDDKHF